jgi:hypothetical protein
MQTRAIRSRPGRSALGLTLALDRIVHSRNVVAQGDPDLVVVDAVVGVRGDDSHALDLPPGDLRRRRDDLIRQLGGNVAQSADDSLAAKRSGRSVSQRFFPRLTSSAAASAASARSARRSSTPWSQIHGLGANMVVPRLQGAPRDDIDSDAEKLLKILKQADVIKKGSAWLEIHEQV